jgi:hypothetical protein
VRFAIINPELFRLMLKAAPRGDQLHLPIDEAHPAMANLRRTVEDVAPPGSSEDDKRATALRCWGLVHGLATLSLDGQIDLDDDMIGPLECLKRVASKQLHRSVALAERRSPSA